MREREWDYGALEGRERESVRERVCLGDGTAAALGELVSGNVVFNRVAETCSAGV